MLPTSGKGDAEEVVEPQAPAVRDFPSATEPVTVSEARRLGLPLSGVSPPDIYPVSAGQPEFARVYTESRDELEKARQNRKAERTLQERQRFDHRLLGLVGTCGLGAGASWAGLWATSVAFPVLSPYWIPASVFLSVVIGALGAASASQAAHEHHTSLLEISEASDEKLDAHQERMIEFRRKEEDIYTGRDQRIRENHEADWKAFMEAKRLEVEIAKLNQETELERGKREVEKEEVRLKAEAMRLEFEERRRENRLKERKVDVQEKGVETQKSRYPRTYEKYVAKAVEEESDSDGTR